MIVCADCDSERVSYTAPDDRRFLCVDCFKRAKLKAHIAGFRPDPPVPTWMIVVVLIGIVVTVIITGVS